MNETTDDTPAYNPDAVLTEIQQEIVSGKPEKGRDSETKSSSSAREPPETGESYRRGEGDPPPREAKTDTETQTQLT